MDDFPSVSVVVETSTWHEGGELGLPQALDALAGQDYPQAKLQVIVVLNPRDLGRWGRISSEYEWVEVLELEDPLPYYLAKLEGAMAAEGELIAFVDADNWVAEDWVKEITRPLRERAPIMVVLGRSRFRPAFLSRMWDPLWWPGAYQDEGPLERVFSANNIAFRASFLKHHYYADNNSYRSVWERRMAAAVHSQGGLIWLNPRAEFYHDYHSDIRDYLQRAISRGSQMIAARRQAPRSGEEHQRRLIFLVPWLGIVPLFVKDVHRIIRDVPKTGLPRGEYWKIPLYLAALVPTEIVVWAGMLLGAYGRRAIPPP